MLELPASSRNPKTRDEVQGAPSPNSPLDPICPVFALLRCLFVSCWRCHKHRHPGPTPGSTPYPEYSVHCTVYSYQDPGGAEWNEESVATSVAVTFNVEIFFTHARPLTDNEEGFVGGGVCPRSKKLIENWLKDVCGPANLMALTQEAGFRHFNVHGNFKSSPRA